jgi:hypothetical protein
MNSRSKDYLKILGVIAGSLIVFVAIGAFMPRGERATYWIFGYLPYVVSAVFALTVPVSLVWMVIAAMKKKWNSVGHLAAAAALPVITFAATAAANWPVLKELVPE